MSPRTRTAVVFAVVATVVVTGFTVSRLHDQRLRREGYAKAQKVKDDIDRRFPAGTLRVPFLEFVRKWPGLQSVSESSAWISVGEVPSHVWYCGPWQVGVRVSFAQDRMSATEVESRGVNCP